MPLAQDARPRRGYIVSPRYDTVFFTASLLVPLLLWGAFELSLLTGVGVYVVFQLAFNLPHNFQTWTLSLLDGPDRARNGRRYVVAALVCTAALGVPMLVSPTGLYPWVRDALIYWGYYHLVRQHFGFLRLYERSMVGVSRRESFAYGRYLDAVCYLPLLIRFRDPELMTIHAGQVETWVQHPVLPASVWVPVAVVYAVAVLAASAHHLWRWSQGRRDLGPRARLLVSVTLGFGLAVLVIDDLIVGIAVVTAFHNLQYLGLVWLHNRNRARLDAVPRNAPIRWLRDGRVWLYVLVSVAYGIVILVPRAALPTVRLAELPLAVVVALHYYVDSRLWRFKDYPERGRYLFAPRDAPTS